MEKEFVSYEIALKLKELGFSELCLFLYNSTDDDPKPFLASPPEAMDWNTLYIEKTNKHLMSAPTYSQTFKFFRDNYRLSVLIYDCLDDYIGEIVEWTLTDDKIIHEVPNRIETYEETELKCLEKLIELVESKSK